MKDKQAVFKKIMDVLHLDLIKRNPPETIEDWKKLEKKEYEHTRKNIAPKITNKKLLHYIAINDPSVEVAMRALENLHDKDLLKEVAEKSEHREVQESVKDVINTREEQKSKLRQLEKELEEVKSKVKGGKITEIFERGLSLKIVISYDVDKFILKKNYYFSFSRGYFEVKIHNDENLGTDPKEAAKKFVSLVPNPYKVVEKGKYKNYPWLIIHNNSEYPPYQGWFPGLGGTDVYDKVDDHLREQIKLQMNSLLEGKGEREEEQHPKYKHLQLIKPKEKAAFLKKVMARLTSKN